MEIKVIVTEKEIMDTPNDYELGNLVRNRYWQVQRDQKGPRIDDETFFLDIDNDGLVRSITRPTQGEYDTCSMCGKETQYLKSTSVDIRVGYIEGAGQLCFECNQVQSNLCI
jgi:hypothetical protein